LPPGAEPAHPTPRTPLEGKGKVEEDRGERRKKREKEEGASRC